MISAIGLGLASVGLTSGRRPRAKLGPTDDVEVGVLAPWRGLDFKDTPEVFAGPQILAWYWSLSQPAA